MDALNKLLTSKEQVIRVVAVNSGEIQRVDISFGKIPTEDQLEPVSRLTKLGILLEVFSTATFKPLVLKSTVFDPKEVAIALSKTWKEQGYQVEVELPK